jgi:hypothetical protein
LFFILVALVLVPFFISKQNKEIFNLLKENQESMRMQIESARKQEIDKKRIGVTLQAYERMMLFLERINPANLVPRVMMQGLTAGKLQTLLLQNIREEYEHNMSQQLFVYSQSWELIKSAKEEVISLVNNAASKVKSEDDAGLLAKEILLSGFQGKTDPVEKAELNLKKDLKDIFNV